MRKSLNTLLACALLMVTSSASAQSSKILITTVAGNGATTPFGPDGLQATASKLNNPWGVTADNQGNFYIADKSNQRIRMVSRAGIITTVAGNGTPAYSGDGFAATAASLNLPSGVAKDNSGNLYIADYQNNVIRKVSTTGIISTFAGPGGTGTPPPLGDGGPATAAYIYQPAAVACDKNGNVYIADQGNERIRVVNAATGIISTVAGTGDGGAGTDGVAATTSDLNIPSAICLDTAGNIYIADENNFKVRKVTAATGIISTVAGTGVAGYSGNGLSAISAQLSYTYGVAVDRSGNVFVSDNDEVREITASTGIISIYAGRYDTTSFGGDGGLADSSKLYNPQGLSCDTSGNLYISDPGNQRIRKVYTKNTTGVLQVVSQNSSINVYPNPNNGTFTIRGTLNTVNDEKVTLTVADMLGQVIYKNSILVNQGIINIQVSLQSGLPDGYYLLDIRSGTEDDLAKFVIQR